MNEKRYRAGIIGLGFAGGGDQVSGDRIGQQVANLDGNHREALSQSERIDLVAGCDLDEGRRARFAERTGARTYADWREVVEREKLDLVSIATSSPGHAPLTIAAAEQGIRVVYCEKPIAVSLIEAERMLAACDRAGTLLVINHNRRFHPNCHRLRELIADGGLGELTGVSLRWGAGRLGCTGTHVFDVVRMLTGRNFTAVSASLDLSEKADCRGPEFHDPGGWGVLKLEGDLPVVVSAANHAAGPFCTYIEGTRGIASLAGRNVKLDWFDGKHDLWQDPGDATSMDRAVAEIVNWLDAGGEFSYPGGEAVPALEAIIGFHASHARNAAWTPLPLTCADRNIEVLSG
jgi:predicted dehydrogenase